LEEFRLGSRTLQPHRQLLADGQRVALGKRALDILSVLAKARGEIVTKDELLEQVWPGVTVEENALQVHIVALRKALGSDADRLKTIRGVGYQLDVADITSLPDSADIDADKTRQRPQSHPESRAAEWLQKPSNPAGWPRSRLRRPAFIFVALLAVMAAGSWTLGPKLSFGSQDRVPLVVRALTVGGQDSTESALAGGITDELVVRLRQIPELRIATAEADGSVPSNAFTDAHVFDGTIRSSGEQLRVTARLLDGDGAVVWSQTFNRRVGELFDLQEEIASAIASALSVSFEVGGNSAAYGGTNNPDAYAAYMQYQAHILDPNFDSRPYLERAVALDPKYAKARAALDGDYGLQVSIAPTHEKPKRLAEMERTTSRALEANAGLWIPIAARGMYDVYRHDFVSADRRFRQVAALDKGIDPELRSKWANYEMLLGRVQKAVRLRRSNELIDPIQRNDPFRVYDFEMLGEYRQAVDRYLSLERKQQRGLGGFVYHAFISLLESGQESEAIRFAEQRGEAQFVDMLHAIRDNPDLPELSAPALRVWAEQHYGKGAEFQLAFSAMFSAHDGHQKLAVEFLRLAFEKPSGGALFHLWHPALAEARKSVEFERLVTDLGMVKAWRESGEWGDYCRPVSAREISCS
jgi:DNA-binding winged helix-turn-helix (wHTH) protein/TolB-like protein